MKRKTVTVPGLLCSRQRNAGGSLATAVMRRLTKDDERGNRPKLKTPASNNITIFSVVRLLGTIMTSLKEPREACQEARFEIVVVNWRTLFGGRMMV